MEKHWKKIIIGFIILDIALLILFLATVKNAIGTGYKFSQDGASQSSAVYSIITDGNDYADIIETNGYNGVTMVTPSHVSTDNSTSTLLGGGETFTGEWEDITNFGVIVITVHADQASATDGLVVEFSADTDDVDSSDSYTIPAGGQKTFSFQTATQYFRVKYTNGATPQTTFHLQTILKPYYVKPSSHRIQDSIVDEDDAELVKAVLTGKDAGGTFVNFQATTAGNFKISLEEVDGTLKDDITGTLITTNFEHHEIHEGDHYFICGHEALSNGQVVDFTFITTSTAQWAHMTFDIEGTGAVSMNVYEDAVVDTPGTATTTFNNNRNSSNTSESTVRIGDTFTSVGSLIYHQYSGASRVSGIIGRNKEIILKQNSTYLFRITNETATTNELNYCSEWYEHTNI